MAIKDYSFTVSGRKFNLERWLPRVLGVIAAYMGWYALATVFPNELMPYPIETIVLTAQVITSGSFLHHLQLTLWRTVLGFIGSMIVGVAFGVVMGINDFGNKFFTPYVIIGLTIPAIAWAAVATLIFGFTVASPVTATILTTFPFIAVNIWKGVESLEAPLIEMSEAFNISNFRVLVRIIIRNTAPAIFAAVRFGLAISWKIVTLAEMFASTGGIGWKVIQLYQLYQFEAAWAWAGGFIVIILVIEYLIFQPIENKVFNYRQEADYAMVGIR